LNHLESADLGILAYTCSIVNEIDRKVTHSMTNKTFLEDFEMTEIGKVSATLARLLQLLVSARILFMIFPCACLFEKTFYLLLCMSFIFIYFFVFTHHLTFAEE